MSYAALNAKLRAMSAKVLNRQGRESISQAAVNICRYIPGKLQRDYVLEMAQAGPIGGIQYYTAQWKRLNRLDKPNRTALRSILGAEIDLTNILWMYRLKRYHRVTGDGTFGYLIPIRYKLSRETTRRMADCTNPKALLDEIAAGPYAADFMHLEKAVSAQVTGLTPEEMLAKAVDRRYKTAARRYPNTLAPALAFLRSR